MLTLESTYFGFALELLFPNATVALRATSLQEYSVANSPLSGLDSMINVRPGTTISVSDMACERCLLALVSNGEYRVKRSRSKSMSGAFHGDCYTITIVHVSLPDCCVFSIPNPQPTADSSSPITLRCTITPSPWCS